MSTPILTLDFTPPFDWITLLAFLRARALKGVEHVTEDAYHRTVSLDGHTGWISVTPAKRGAALALEHSPSMSAVTPEIRRRVRNVFDLDAQPDEIAHALVRDTLFAASVAAAPGLRVPGAFNGFEMAVRAILGQQITVKAAATLSGRFAVAFGEEVATPFDALTHLTPLPERIAAASVDEIASLGIIRTRTQCIIRIAEETAAGRLTLEAGADPHDTIRMLVALPGIGPWTAHYIAMRALRWNDAFPKEDIVIRQRLGGVSAAAAEARSQAWRPWRSYATLHLWRMSQ